MTCYDCIHFDNCLDNEKTRYYGTNIACDNVEERCKFFKNKSNFIEIIKCKDCKHATEDIMIEGVCYCHKIQQGMFLDGFCSYGERRNTK